MENTGNVLFENDSPQWFVAQGDKWIGPMTAQEVYDKIGAGLMTWADFVWKTGQPEWQRICDLPTFQAVVPMTPPASVQAKVREEVLSPSIAKSASAARQVRPLEEKIWFLHYGDAPIGPFSPADVARYLKIGKIHGRVYAWKDGMPDWDRIENIAAFQPTLLEISPPKAQPVPPAHAPLDSSQGPSKKVDQRKAPRHPMVARILLAEEQGESVNVAICRDISIGGMQVLTDRIPGPVGTKIRLNVSPPVENQPDSFRAFVAHGMVVRVLEDGRGFSFRFESLGAEAKQAIEGYIAQTS